MLPLTSPRWHDLYQAHGTAEDIPRLLEALASIEGQTERAELWFGVWSTLCPDDRVYSAAYAATPHILAVGRERGGPELVAAMHVIAQVECLRHVAGAPSIDDDLVLAYATTVESMPAIVTGFVDEPWDTLSAQILAAALLAGKRQPSLAREILALSQSAP